MKKLILAVCCLMCVLGRSQDQWKLDSSHSSILFSVDHLVISEVTGSFNSFEGVLEMSEEEIETAKIKGEIDVKSIDTKNGQRDAHLRAPDFFDIADHPKISFESNEISKQAGDRYQMKGDLTIKGNTKEVVFDVVYKGTAVFMGAHQNGHKGYNGN